MNEKKPKVRIPYFPDYSDVKQLIPVFNGLSKSAILSMFYAFDHLRGTPQNPVDWSNPDNWISEKLDGENAQIAHKIWTESQKTVNPRHAYGGYAFINGYQLLEPDSSGIFRITDKGQGFLDGDEKIIQQLDEAEGLVQLLLILSTKGQVRRGDILGEWGEYLRKYTNIGTDSSIKDTLSRRLQNLAARKLISRDGNRYSITQTGIDYVSKSRIVIDDPRKKVMRAVKSFNDKQIEALRQRLGSMPPFAFEHLVRDLLEAMGYEDVTVTKESGDKGVDVVATVQFGITTITEVVQVKRHQGSISRPVLDQLRGALPYHKALRGTIITIGKFTQGCKDAALFPGAAPIGLIDGQRLLELLVEHKIGIVERPATLYEIDESYFTTTDEAPLEDG